jgi:signal transduction histidine kinase
LIIGPVAHLRDAQGLDPARVRSELEVVHRNVLRLGKLVTSLLDFSRIQAGQFQPGYEPVDLAALTDELASVFRSAMQLAGLSFVVDCRPLPGPVFVDRDMQLVAALRVDPATAAVPVLLLSARAGQEAAVEGLAAGADDYLVKPFAAREFLARVAAHA